MTVLIVSGAPEDRAALRETLMRDQTACYSAIEAETGARALELCRARRPDCLILAEGLPDLSVVETLKQLTAEDGSLACAVVALVSEGAARLAVEAMKSGAHDCLEKDRAKGEELRRAVSYAIEKAGQRQVKAQGRETVEKNQALGAGLAAFKRGVAERSRGEDARWGARVRGGAERALVSQPEIADLKRTEKQQRDVTKRQRAEEAPRESEEEFRSLFDLSAIGMMQVSPSGKFLRVNRKLCQMLGYSEQEMLQLTLHDVTHPDDREFSVAALDSSFTGRPDEYSMEKRYLRKDGSIIWVLINWEIIRDSRGQMMRSVGNIQDITARKRANEAQLRAILDNAAAVIFVKDLEGRYLRVNRWYEAMHGMPEAEVKGKTDYDLHSKEIADTLRANDREVIAANGPLQFEEQIAFADGLRHFISVKFPLGDDNGRPYAVCGIAIDITERKRAEEALRESEARFRHLADAMPQILYTCTPDGATDYVNQQWREYTGTTMEPAWEAKWLEQVHPDDRERVWSLWVKSITTGQPYESEYRLRRNDGQYRWRMSRTIPVRDEGGRIVQWVGTSTDIHDRKQAEAEREELLVREQAAREIAEAANRSKDEFLAVVSHELRTPLNAMLGYARLLRYGPLEAQKVRQAVEIIERNGKAQSQLIDDLLDTAHIISGKLKLEVWPVDLVAVIQDAIQTIYLAADAKSISIKTDLKPEVGQITGDPTRLQQVVWNLLSNAVKFTPTGGRVEVRLERLDPHVCIIVSDTGKGISPDFLPYIFDRFRQSDASSVRKYGGFGLGLALVKYLVELHGGTIEASSAGEGRGATFKVLLPVRAVSSPLSEKELIGGETNSHRRRPG